jgi:hypothetical protein
MRRNLPGGEARTQMMTSMIFKQPERNLKELQSGKEILAVKTFKGTLKQMTKTMIHLSSNRQKEKERYQIVIWSSLMMMKSDKLIKDTIRLWATLLQHGTRVKQWHQLIVSLYQME